MYYKQFVANESILQSSRLYFPKYLKLDVSMNGPQQNENTKNMYLRGAEIHLQLCYLNQASSGGKKPDYLFDTNNWHDRSISYSIRSLIIGEISTSKFNVN